MQSCYPLTFCGGWRISDNRNIIKLEQPWFTLIYLSVLLLDEIAFKAFRKGLLWCEGRDGGFLRDEGSLIFILNRGAGEYLVRIFRFSGSRPVRREASSSG